MTSGCTDVEEVTVKKVSLSAFQVSLIAPPRLVTVLFK
jgi:hypothetical protein